jgi:hypothetical protein
MTKRLTPEQKARRKFWRKQHLRARTPAETREFLAMIKRQGEEAEARGKRIAAQKLLYSERWQDEAELSAGGPMRIWGPGPNACFQGNPPDYERPHRAWRLPRRTWRTRYRIWRGRWEQLKFRLRDAWRALKR